MRIGYSFLEFDNVHRADERHDLHVHSLSGEPSRDERGRDSIKYTAHCARYTYLAGWHTGQRVSDAYLARPYQ